MWFIYFQSLEEVNKIKDEKNPTIWMLEVSSLAIEAQLGVDFVEIYVKSELYRRNQELIIELSTPAPGTQDLHFATTYSRSVFIQFQSYFWKQNLLLETSTVQCSFFNDNNMWDYFPDNFLGQRPKHVSTKHHQFFHETWIS